MAELVLQVQESSLIVSIEGDNLNLQESPLTLTLAEIGQQGPPGADGQPGSSYERTFADSDLSVADLLPVIHNLNSYPSGLALYNSVGEQVFPDSIEFVSFNALSVSLSSFRPLSGTWRISVTA